MESITMTFERPGVVADAYPGHGVTVTAFASALTATQKTLPIGTGVVRDDVASGIRSWSPPV